MRKFIAFILLALTMVGTAAGLFAPTMTNMSLGSEFQTGREYVYQIVMTDNEDGIIDSSHAESIANTFRERLDISEINTYNVTVEGEDTIRMQFAADTFKYDYISQYVNFNPVFDEMTLSTSADGQEISGDSIFKEGMQAEMKMRDGEPIVLLPIKSENNEQWKIFMEDAKKIADAAAEAAAAEAEAEGGAQHAKIRRADSGTGSVAGLFLWANKEDHETYNMAASNEDPRVAKKILARIQWGESEDGSDMFYDAETLDTLVLKASDLTMNGYTGEQMTISQYTFLSKWLVNMLNAEEYRIGDIDYTVNLLYDGSTGNVLVPPTTENLLNLGTHITVRVSDTLIAFILAFALITLVFGILFRLSAIATCTISGMSVFLTLALFAAFSIEFNVAAVLGLVISLIASFVGQAIYLTKLKKEYASGKTMKKANEEASRKSILPVVDISVIQIIIGAFFFLLGGRFLMPFGIIMMVGGLFNALFNTFGMKAMMYLLTNESAFENRPRLLGLDPQVEPTLEVSKKEAGEGEAEATPNEPVIKKVAKKHSLKFMIGAGVLSVVAIIGLSVFGAINDGNVLNNGNLYQENSRLYIKVDRDISPINDENMIAQALSQITLLDENGDPLVTMVDEQEEFVPLTYVGSIARFTNVEYVEDGDGVLENTLTFYVITLDGQYDGTENVLYTPTSETIAFSEAVQKALSDIGGDDVTSSIKKVQVITGQSNTWPILASLLFSSLVCAFYIAIRYRVSRGLAMFLVSMPAVLIVLGFLSLTRIAVSPLVLLSTIVIAVVIQIVAVFFFTLEKDNIKALKLKRLTTEQKRTVMLNSVEEFSFNSLAALLLPVCFAVPYLVLGPTTYVSMFAVSMLGFALVGLPLLLVVLGPLGFYLNRLFGKIWNALPKPNPDKAKASKKKRAKNIPTKGAEPQEAIFIGINDFR